MRITNQAAEQYVQDLKTLFEEYQNHIIVDSMKAMKKMYLNHLEKALTLKGLVANEKKSLKDAIKLIQTIDVNKTNLEEMH